MFFGLVADALAAHDETWCISAGEGVVGAALMVPAGSEPMSEQEGEEFAGAAPCPGSALLRALLERADRTGTPTYLEATSADNRRLYQRHGFQVIDELAIAGAPPLWAM